MGHTERYDLMSWHPGDIFSFKLDLSGFRCDQARDGMKGRCLSGTIGTDQCNDFSLIYLKIPLMARITP